MTRTIPIEQLLQQPPDFSLVVGGPVFQAFRRAHLTGNGLELARRRIVVITLLLWFPLLVLSLLDTRAAGVHIPFLFDFETYTRFLIAIPALVAAEIIIHTRLRHAVGQFIGRGIVPPDQMPGFEAAIDAAIRRRNSIPLEIGALVLVYTLGLWVWRSQVALGGRTWYLDEGRLTLAGYWYAYLSVPIFQFLLLRWYLRMANWAWFLWRVSRLKLRLIPTHPDRSGGLAFLGTAANAFSPVLFAQGALLAGLIANRIFHEGKTLPEFKLDIAALAGVFVIAVIGPLLVFSPALAQAKVRGRREYGLLAARYSLEFHDKWIHGGAGEEQLLGSADIQSLADLGNSYATVREMRAVPFGLDAVVRLALVSVAPVLPLVLTVIPLETILERLVKIVF